MKTLLFKPTDFDEEEADDLEDEEEDWSCNVSDDVEPLGGNRFRVVAPVSLTPFALLGPALTMGQVIEAEPVSPGVWRYVRTHFKPAVWSWRLSCETPDALDDPFISQDLKLLQQLNCQWECCGGNITVQKVSMEGEPLLSEVERIVDRLSQKLQQAR